MLDLLLASEMLQWLINSSAERLLFCGAVHL